MVSEPVLSGSCLKQYSIQLCLMTKGFEIRLSRTQIFALLSVSCIPGSSTFPSLSISLPMSQMKIVTPTIYGCQMDC